MTHIDSVVTVYKRSVPLLWTHLTYSQSTTFTTCKTCVILSEASSSFSNYLATYGNPKNTETYPVVHVYRRFTLASRLLKVDIVGNGVGFIRIQSSYTTSLLPHGNTKLTQTRATYFLARAQHPTHTVSLTLVDESGNSLLKQQ
jgi:hypothetical protein